MCNGSYQRANKCLNVLEMCKKACQAQRNRSGISSKKRIQIEIHVVNRLDKNQWNFRKSLPRFAKKYTLVGPILQTIRVIAQTSIEKGIAPVETKKRKSNIWPTDSETTSDGLEQNRFWDEINKNPLCAVLHRFLTSAYRKNV